MLQSVSDNIPRVAAGMQQLPLVAAGAIMLDKYVSSLEAELAGLEMAIGALLEISRGYADVVPHYAGTDLNAIGFLESHYHLLSFSCTSR